MTFGLLAASFVALLAGALLFTNSIEWAGARLGLGTGAVGSILAAVATALPESIIPIVAIIAGTGESRQVAIGAIVGAPFMLATIAMLLVGLAAFAFAGRREQGRTIDTHRVTLRRDLLFFLAFFGIAFAVGFGAAFPVRVGVAVLLVVAYAAFVWRSLRKSGDVAEEESLDPLYFDWTKSDPPPSALVAVQLVVGLGAIIGGANVFVEEVVEVSERLGVTPIVLALILAPLATELPEKFNSFIWIREGEDSLALGNITGAMAFQSTIPVAVGVVFTDWNLSRYALIAAGIALAGGAIAFWALYVRRCATAPVLAAWGALFAGFVAFMFGTTG